MRYQAKEVLRSIGVDPDSTHLQEQLQFTKSGQLRKLIGSNFKVDKG